MTKLLSAVSILALCATPVLAAGTGTKFVSEEASETVNAAEASVKAAAGDATDAIGTAADKAGDMASDAAASTQDAVTATGDMARDAMQATGNAAEQTGEALQDSAQTAGAAVETTAPETSEAVQAAAQKMSETREEANVTTAMDAATDGVPMTADSVVLTSTFRASHLMGNSIYALETEDGSDAWTVTGDVNDIAANYDDIGSIDDLLINDQGKIVGVLAEVGGFLGIGDKLVLLGLDEIRVTVSDGNPYYVTRITADALEDREAVDDSLWTN